MTRENKKVGGDASSFAKAPADKEAAAGDPSSPRLRRTRWRIKGGDEAA